MSDRLSSADIAAGQDTMIATATATMAPPIYGVDGGLDSSVAASASDVGSDFDHDEMVVHQQHVPWPLPKDSPKVETSTSRRASSDLADITEESDNDTLVTSSNASGQSAIGQLDNSPKSTNEVQVSNQNQNQQLSQPVPGNNIPMKFQYQPLDFEIDYYIKLFDFAKSNKGEPILPPTEAAQLFAFSSIPSDRLRMIWNMSVMPWAPYPPGVKPPPAMNFGQFKGAIRLIQLYQNRVTAKDDLLKVETGVMLAPAYFAGVSGVIVPLPWKDFGQSNGNAQQALPGRRAPESSIEKEIHEIQTALTSSPTGRKMRRSSALSRTSSSVSEGKQTNGAIRRHFSGEEKNQGSPDKGGGHAVVQPGLNRRESTEMVTYGVDDGYIMSSNEFLTYQDTFLRHCVSENNNGSSQHVYVDEAVRLFEKSGLDRAALGKLWDVVVKDADLGMLDEEEFVLMTHLIICVTRRNLPVPNELPASLRNWRDHGFQRTNSGQPQSNGTTGVGAAASVGNVSHNKSHSQLGVASSAAAVGNHTQKNVRAQAQNNNTNGERKRVDQMEREIRSLRKVVDSLTTEVKELKGLIENNAANPFVAQNRAGTNHMGESDHGSSKPMYDSASNDDVPNVDVEMYWGNKSDDESYDEPAPTYSNYPSSSLGMHKPPVHKAPVPFSEPSPAPTEAPKRLPPSALRQSSAAMRSSGTSMRSNRSTGGTSMRSNRSTASQSVRNLRISQNIPSVHPSAMGQRARAQSMLPNMHHGMPQIQPPQMAKATGILDGSNHSGLSGPDGSNRSSNRVFAKSMVNVAGATDNLATQMQHVQREEKFTSLIQRTKQRLESDSGSLSGSQVGSKSSSKYPASRNDSFKPAQVKPSFGQRRDSSRRPLRASLVDSARHVLRRESGESEIYKEKIEPSTAAVDLQPL